MTDTIRHAGWREWTAVAALGIGSFAIVTTELAPIGLLSQIGSDLSKPPQTVGLIVTLYAWIAAAAALASAVMLGRVPRRPLLIGLLLVLASSSVMAAMADAFQALMMARIVGALAHGAFWAMIGTLGAQIVPPRHVGLATSIIFGGVSAATVLGVPLANFIGTTTDWRTAFGSTAVLALAVAGAVWLSVPPLQGNGSVGTETLKRVLRHSGLRRIFIATLLSITAHFMAFTYIEPFLSRAEQIPLNFVAPLLFAFGVAGLAANVLTGALIDDRLKMILTSALVLASLALGSLAIMGSGLGVVTIAPILLVWGGSVAAIFVGFQTWILREAGADALPASAIYVALFNAAIGLGAVVGAISLNFGSFPGLFLIAGLFTGLGSFTILVLRQPMTVAAQ